MLKYILKRILTTIPVLFCIITVTFFMIRLAPGGPFSQDRRIPPAILEKINAHYGLDKPVVQQYFLYLNNLRKGDLGLSLKYEGHPVSELIADSFPVSFEIGLYAMIFAIIVGMGAGILAACKRNTILDYAPMTLAMSGICLPTFVMGPLLALIFGLWLRWFNVAGWFMPSDRVLPSVTIGLVYAAYFARLTRGGMLEVLSQDYIRTARAKGVSEFNIILRHALKGGVIPVISFMGPAFAGIITGSFVVETVFSLPGLGRHFVNASLNRDYTLILGTVLFYASLIIVMNLIVDILLGLLNPRLRLDES